MQTSLHYHRLWAARFLSLFSPARGHNLFYFWGGLLTLLVLGTARPAFSQTTTTTSFTYNGTDGTDGLPQSFTVPTGVTQLTVVAFGAAGGSLSSRQNGGRVDAVMSVTAGDVLNIYVGGLPTLPTTGGFNGGGEY